MIEVIEDARQNLNRHHPFDVEHGVDTSGYITAKEITNDDVLATKISGYSGTHPSIVRQAIGCLPASLNNYTFYDLGCGKGRPLIVASEFSFSNIVGIELCEELVNTARSNAKIIADKYPDRPPIEIVHKSATDLSNLTGNAVLFLYNPFGKELVEEMANSIVERLASKLEHVFIIYHNPYWGAIFDDHPQLTRWSAKQFTCASSEKEYGYPTEGATVIWQSIKNAQISPHDRPKREIVRYGSKATGLAS